MKSFQLFALVFFIFPIQSFDNLTDVKVGFEIKNAGITVDGTFESVEIEFFKEDGKIRFKGTADPKSIRTGIGLRDKHLQKTDYFNSEKFPEITIETKGINPNDLSPQELIFIIQVKDFSKEVEGIILLKPKSNMIYAEAEFFINRLDFNLGEESLILSDEVKVNVNGLMLYGD